MAYSNESNSFKWGFHTKYVWKNGKPVWNGHGAESHIDFRPKMKDKLRLIIRILFA